MNERDSQRGMVPLTVLWAIALCSVLAMATSTTFRSLAGIVGIDRERVQADALLTAGLEAAAGMVSAMGDAPLVARGTTVALATGSVRVAVSDEGGRIDIDRAPAELLASLLRYGGAEDDDARLLSKRIVELRGPDQEKQPNDVEKAPAPAAAKPGQPLSKPDQPTSSAAAMPFTDVRQLASIPGMRPEWIAAIAPLVTVYGSDGVNPLTASVAVLRSLPSVDETRLDTFLKMRSAPLVDPEQLAFMLGSAQKYLKVEATRVVAVDLIAGTRGGYTAAAKAFIVPLRDDKQPYRVLSWNPTSPFADTVALRGAR